MKRPKVSVIIPAYNCEKYIHRCIDSVLRQTFTDFELIVIDDGSKDNTLRELKTYKNRRVKVYHHANRGVANTRNRGIQLAKGDYIVFIDNDDYIDADYIETFYSAITSAKADVVIGGYSKDDKVFLRPRAGEFAKYVVVAPWARIFRLDFLNRHQVEFFSNNLGEDIYFNLRLYTEDPRLETINYAGYHWVTNQKSVSHTSQTGLNPEINIIRLLDYLKANIKSNSYVEYFLVRFVVWYLLYGGRTAKPATFMSEYHKYFTWLRQNIPNFAKNPHIRLTGPKGEEPRFGFYVWTFITLHKFHLLNLFSKLYCKGKN